MKNGSVPEITFVNLDIECNICKIAIKCREKCSAHEQESHDRSLPTTSLKFNAIKQLREPKMERYLDLRNDM